MEVRTHRRLESARRSLQAGFEHLETGDFRSAGALFRCAGKYLSEIGERDVMGEIITFPLAARALPLGARSDARDWMEG
jgi:hypothetical protein